MQSRKPRIQPLHLLTVLPRIVILLPIPRLLMLPLLHDPRRHGAQVRPIDRRRDQHAHHRRQDRKSVLGSQHAEDATAWRLGGEAGGAMAGICQRHDDGEGGLDGEVDGGELGLQGGELGPGKGAVGDDSVDEGLVEGGAEEGAIAVERVGGMLAGGSRLK